MGTPSWSFSKLVFRRFFWKLLLKFNTHAYPYQKIIHNSHFSYSPDPFDGNLLLGGVIVPASCWAINSAWASSEPLAGGAATTRPENPGGTPPRSESASPPAGSNNPVDTLAPAIPASAAWCPFAVAMMEFAWGLRWVGAKKFSIQLVSFQTTAIISVLSVILKWFALPTHHP